jgi:mRNA interferase MazF
VVGVPKQDEIWLISVDPTKGAEIRKTRPCVIVSPDDLNRYLQTVIVAPMTTVTHRYPTRVPILHAGKTGEIVLDQLRAVDRQRLVRRFGRITQKTAENVSSVLLELFARR